MMTSEAPPRSPEGPSSDPASEPLADADAASAEALLGLLAGAARPGEVPALFLSALDARVLVAVVEGHVSAAAFPEAGFVKPAGAGRTALVAMDTSGEASARALLCALARLPAGVRAGVAWANGTASERGVLGEAPARALETLGRHGTPGIYLQASVRPLAPGPLLSAGEDFRFVPAPAAGPRRTSPRWLGWTAGLLAAGLLAALLPAMTRPAPPHATLVVLGERAPENLARGPAEPLTLTEGDSVRTVMTAETGAFVTLLVFDSSDTLSVPPTDAGPNREQVEIQERWVLDAHPGTEQILAVVARARWADVQGTLDAVNGAAHPTRAARLDALEAALAERVPGQVRLLRGAEIRHVPR